MTNRDFPVTYREIPVTYRETPFNMKTNMELEQRSYDKAELAMLYFPQSTPTAALKRLTRWIGKNPELCKKLEASNLSKYSKYWSRKQVEIIVFYLGDP